MDGNSSPGSCALDCACSNDSSARATPLPQCVCADDSHGLVVHERDCLYYNNAEYVYQKPKIDTPKPSDDLLSLESEIVKLGVCTCGRTAAACTCKPARYTTEHKDLCLCCKYPVYKCRCDADKREQLEKWRTDRPIVEAMPAVLEATHPLMQKFQETLKKFLEKENATAEEEILNLSDELKIQKTQYDKDLAAIYRHDHDTNQQRVLIEEYEQALANTTKERQAQEAKANESATKHKAAKEKFNQDIVNEREVMEELEALGQLVQQLEEWRRETESELAVSQRLSDKMRLERKQRAHDKRQLDITIFRLTNEVWRLESEMGLYEQQMKIKSGEAEEVHDRIAGYTAELEDLDLEQRRLLSLWNSVLINIGHRDKVYNSVKDDYHNLQENYRTLLSNLEATKKSTAAELTRSQGIAMNKDKFLYDLASATKLYETEDFKRLEYETKVAQLEEAVDMSEKDQELIKNENHSLENVLKNSKREYEKRIELKMQLENEILAALQDCLLNDKASTAMAAGIKSMREMARKQEISLTQMENSHAKVMLDIEMLKMKQKETERTQMQETARLEARAREVEHIEEQVAQNNVLITKRQRELDAVQKKYAALMEIFDSKSPQERRVEELERQIAELRARTETLQQDWLRLQGHVVRLTQQHQRQLADISLIQKQIQICDHALARLDAEAETTRAAHEDVERSLRTLRGRLEVLERARRDHEERNQDSRRTNLALTHEYTASLKDSEAELIQLEEDIANLEIEKENLAAELDKVQREALVWQRKGILAVDLKKSIQAAKSDEGEMFKMRSEIHKMTVRREQLKRIGEKLATDLSLCVVRRDTVIEKVRATEALEKHGGAARSTAQSQYKHKLRLARGDVQRVTKDIKSTQDQLEQLAREEQRLQEDISAATDLNNRLEERVATLQRETHEADVNKQWYLERVVRSQRLGSELATIIKKQVVKLNKSESAIATELEQSRAFNESIRDIVTTVISDYPYMESKLQSVLNTLNIQEPCDTPKIDSPSYASVTCECD